METVKAKYSANINGGGINITEHELPLELNKMIVWIMTNANAMYLLPEYEKLRQQCDDLAEGSAKNHGIES